MRRPLVVRAGPTTNLGGLGDVFAQMYNSVPGPQERQMQQAQLAAQQAQTDLYGAKADQARQEVNQARQIQAGRGGMADAFASMAGPSDYQPSQEQLAGSGRTFAATYGMPTEENTANYAAAQDQFGQDEMARAASEAFEIATRSGVDAQEASRIIRTGLAKQGASPEYIQRLGFAVNPSYALNENQGVSAGDREHVAARNDLQETALNRMDNRTSLQQTGMQTSSRERIAAADRYADPITAKPDEKILPNPNDPRTKGYEGPEMRVGNRVAGGERVNDQQAAMVGADGGSDGGVAAEYRQYYDLARNQMGLDEQQAKQYASQQVSKSKGIRIGPDGSVEIGGSSGPDIPGSTESALLNENKQLDDFMSMTDRATGLAQESPEAFGVVGNLRRLGQNVEQQVQNISGSLGIDFQDEYQSAVATMADAANWEEGERPPREVFDPNLSNIKKLAILLAFKGARSIAGETGRLSNFDFQIMQDAIGDPTNFFSSAARFKSGIEMMREIVQERMGRNADVLEGRDSGSRMNAPQAAPAAPPGGSGDGSGKPKRYYNPATGDFQSEPIE